MNSKLLMTKLVIAEVSNIKHISYSKITEEAFWETYDLARKHDVSQLIAAAGRRHNIVTDQNDKKKLQAEQYKAVWRVEHIIHEQKKLFETLETAGINYLPLKGAVIRDYYPEPWMRTSCDIDVLVQREDLDKAVDVLTQNLNYINKGKHYHDVSLFSPSNVHLELHFTLNVDNPVVDQKLAHVWEQVSLKAGTQHCYVMEPEFFLFYLIAHMAGHFLRGGCGVRPVLDIWILKKKLEHNNKILQELCMECGLLRFLNAIEKISAVWFENEEHDALSSAVEEYIFNGGVYGSSENRIVISQSRNQGKLGYWKSRLFISPEVLQGVYPELEKRPKLYPYYQVKRWFRFLNKKTRQRIAREFKKGQEVQKDSVNTMSDLLERLGLLKN